MGESQLVKNRCRDPDSVRAEAAGYLREMAASLDERAVPDLARLHELAPADMATVSIPASRGANVLQRTGRQWLSR